MLASAGTKANASASGLSPLVQSYNDWNFNRPYGHPLPHPIDVFTQGAFGPLMPIQPVGIDPPADSGRPAPRRSQYPVGWNLPSTPGSEGIKLTTFATLRAIADMYSVARACVDKRISEIVGLGWDIVPTDEAEHAMRGDDDLRADWEKRRAQVVDFFEHPDSDRAKYPTFESWLTGLLEDRFVVDAVALHLRPPRKKGAGPFGSNLASLDLLDGTTIRPLLTLAGATPEPATVGYQQYLWGVPRVDLMSVITEADLDGLDEPVDEFRADQLLYLRAHPRNWTPYGFGPIEKALLPISIGLARQQYQQDYYTDGSIPGQFITPGPDISTPQQIRQLQDALNSMAGDIGAKHRIIVLPPGSKAELQKPVPLADQTDEWILSQVAMAFSLTPMDLGVTPRVSAVQSPSESRQLSEINTDKGSQTRIEPETTRLKSTVFDYVIQKVFKQTDMEWSWGLTDRGDSRDDQIQQHISLVGNGLESVDEARVDLGHTPWGLPETSVPLWATSSGPVPLSGIATPTGGADIDDVDGGAPASEQPNKPADEELTTPAHEAAEDLSDTPGGSTEPEASAKALTAELEILGRYLRKGRPVARFRSTVLPAEALAAAEAELPKGVAAAVQAAAAAVVRKNRQQRRATHLHHAMTRVASGLGRLAHDVRKGRISHATFVDNGVDVMAGGYEHAMTAGSADASDDHPDTPTIDLRDQAQERAQGQSGFLGRLLGAVMAAAAVSDLLGRLRMYGDTLVGAYNAGYGLTVQAAHPKYEIEWVLGETEHCELCIERDGKIYTFDNLPGWPGDGGFGGIGAICLGGPKCGCTLIYREGGKTMALGTNTQREAAGPYYQSQLDTITTARRAADQAREDFLGTIPADAAARAHTRDSIRRELADLANQRIRAAGGYPGVSVEPQDIPAQMVADLLPPSAKAIGAPVVKQDVAATVYEALAKVYPADTITWVKDATWRYEKSVRLADIDMARRPGGRDQSKVEGIAAAIADGKVMAPVVLVDTDDPAGLQVADGYHRTLGAKRAGKTTIAAYVATGTSEHGPWEREMHDSKLNKTSTREDSVTSDIVPGWEGAQGPFKGEYSQPHVYARDIHSGAGNCVCGSGLGDAVHIQAAPGVEIPDRMR